MTSVVLNNDAVVDDWESVPSDHVSQLAQQKQAVLKRQQKSAAAEEKCLQNEKPTNDQGIGSIIQKPLRLLKREKPTRQSRTSESEEATKTLAQLTLDERIANYDKIRQRIFNADEGKKPEASEESTSNGSGEKNKQAEKTKGSNGVTVEAINHLTHVPMLSEDTHQANNMRPPPQHFYNQPMDLPPMIPPMIPPMMMMHGGQSNIQGYPSQSAAPPFIPPPTWMPPPPIDLNHAPLPYGHPPPPLGQGFYNPKWMSQPPPSISQPTGARLPTKQPVPLKNIKAQLPNNKNNLNQPSKRQSGPKAKNNSTGSSKK
ncbi:unnamed protein product [Bursaphelenchus okinawaensis]|uniref:SUZ domain-containing protein n=1 Tax=Bursaphelenchus okinawaensis TaxID=465554 RepID=A0A811K6Q2_9BILA|nr:unnamed protein product [Bursaphelenchus okinawaensis]CAG9092640.1 unnamed protein product [Bursaphelenchus okinawaensis]